MSNNVFFYPLSCLICCYYSTEVEPALPPLKKLADDPYVHIAIGGILCGWTCGWCQKFLKPYHSTRALHHLAMVVGGGIQICTGAIDPRYLARYKALFAMSEKRNTSNKDVIKAKEDYTAHRQSGAAVAILQKRKKTGAAEMLQNFLQPDEPAVVDLTNPKRARSHQPSIEASMQSAGVRDVRDCNNALLSSAIADMCHCDNLPDRFVESVRFRRMLKLARLVGNDYR